MSRVSVQIWNFASDSRDNLQPGAANLAELCRSVVADRDEVIRRRGAEDVALISAAELASLKETAHLLRSPKNAARLLTALARAKDRAVPPQSLKERRT